MISDVLEHVRGAILGTLFAPQSTLSIVALLCTFLVAAGFVLIGRKRPRSVRFAVLLRAVFPRRIWRTPSGRADIGWAAYSIFLSGLGVGWMIVSSQWFAGQVHQATDGAALLFLPALLAVPLATIFVFLAYEFAYWLDHFLMHKIPALWAFHRVHHSAEHLSLLTNFRIHPLETVLYYNLLALIVGTAQGLSPVLFGPEAAPTQIGGLNILVMLFAVTVTHLQHSHFWVSYGPKWGRLLLGPAHHQLHHSSDPAHYDCNLGSSLTLFDRLAGTFIMPGRERENLVLGIRESEFDPHSFPAMTVKPFADAAAILAKPLQPLQKAEREA